MRVQSLARHAMCPQGKARQLSRTGLLRGLAHGQVRDVRVMVDGGMFPGKATGTGAGRR